MGILEGASATRFTPEQGGRWIVVNTLEDWWRLEQCFIVQVSEDDFEQMSENYDGKWWRYDYEFISEYGPMDILEKLRLPSPTQT